MLGNGVTPAAGAAEPLWQAELPNLARNINLTQKWGKTKMQPIHHKSRSLSTSLTNANGQNMSLSTAPVGWN